MTASTSEQPQLAAAPVKAHLTRNNFDFLRLLFAVLVILAHAWGTGRVQGAEPWHVFTARQDQFGGLAVDSFFAISGYLITASALRSRSIVDYLIKRILRIYPAFIAATLVMLLVVYPLSIGQLPAFWKPKAALHVLLSCVMLRRVETFAPFERVAWPVAFPHNPLPGNVNGSMWTIPYEFGCYFLVAILAVLVLRRHRLLGSIVTACLFAAAYIFLVYRYHNQAMAWPPHSRAHFDYFLLPLVNWPRFLTYFLAGALVFYFQSRIRFHYLWALTSLLLLIAAAVSPHFFPGRSYYHELAPFLFTYLVFAVAFEPRIRLHAFARFGDFSYGTYLYAFPIQQLLQQYQPDLSPWTHFAIAAPASIACGALSWHLVEKWFMRLKPKPIAPAAPSRLA